MNTTELATRRELLKRAGLLVTGTSLWAPSLSPAAGADDTSRDEAAAILRRHLIQGLDGMSRVAEDGNNPFSGGHNAAAVIASVFFCRQEKIDPATQKEMRALIETRLLSSRIYAPRPKEPADPALVDGLIKDLDAGIATLRQAGHNIIFAILSLNALRDAPEAATPARIAGLRSTIQSFGKDGSAPSRRREHDSYLDLADEQKFIGFIIEEYLKALERYLDGVGHHGFAGHLLTVGHALVELARMGHKETAQKGVLAYWHFVDRARREVDRNGRKATSSRDRASTPLTRQYWIDQNKRRTGEIVSSHLIKYPFSFYALIRELKDAELKRRSFEKLAYLTAVS